MYATKSPGPNPGAEPDRFARISAYPRIAVAPLFGPIFRALRIFAIGVLNLKWIITLISILASDNEALSTALKENLETGLKVAQE